MDVYQLSDDLLMEPHSSMRSSAFFASAGNYLLLADFASLLHSSSYGCFHLPGKRLEVDWQRSCSLRVSGSLQGACFYQGWNSRPSIILTELTAIQPNQRSFCQQSKGFSLKEFSSGLSSGRGVPSCQQARGTLWFLLCFLFSSLVRSMDWSRAHAPPSLSLALSLFALESQCAIYFIHASNSAQLCCVTLHSCLHCGSLLVRFNYFWFLIKPHVFFSNYSLQVPLRNVCFLIHHLREAKPRKTQGSATVISNIQIPDTLILTIIMQLYKFLTWF